MSEIPIRFLERVLVSDPEANVSRARFHTSDGQIVRFEELQAGDAYYVPCEGQCHLWDNCGGLHLYVVLPKDSDGDQHHWCVDGRCSNCTLKEDRVHRCWVRHGDPAAPGSLHVDKAGVTCQAGAGSILVGGWHGFLHRGRLVKC